MLVRRPPGSVRLGKVPDVTNTAPGLQGIVAKRLQLQILTDVTALEILQTRPQKPISADFRVSTKTILVKPTLLVRTWLLNLRTGIS